MKKLVSHKYLLPALWVSISACLAGILYWEWEQGLALRTRLLQLQKIPVSPIPDQKILAEFALPELDKGFPELVGRPIFSTSRRSMGSPEQGGGMKKGQFLLVGVVITPQQRFALLRDPQGTKTEAIQLGAIIRGMTLGDVQQGRVVLRQGAEQEELMLNVQMGGRPPTSIPATPSAAPGVAPPPTNACPATSGGFPTQCG